MPSSRRLSASPPQRRNPIKGEGATHHHTPRHSSPREAERNSQRLYQMGLQSPSDRIPATSYSVTQGLQQVSMVSQGQSSDAKDSKLQQLPSLRTLINLPPLQTPNSDHAQPWRSLPSPLANSNHMTLQSRETHGESAMSIREYLSASHPSAPASYTDDRFTYRARPSSEASFRPTTRHGPMVAGTEYASPGSTNSSIVAHHSDVYGSQIAYAEHGQPHPTIEHAADIRRSLQYRDGQQLNLVEDKSLSAPNSTPVNQPRYVGQENIPGKGLCYVYEDGSYCEVVVRGEAVNPEWGLTRAGRARKRLAKACNGCRMKKVKCEPGNTSRCQRCSRKGQECQWSHLSETSPERESYEARSVARNIYPQSAETPYAQQYSVRMPPSPPYTISAKNSYEPVSSMGNMEPRPMSKRLRSGSSERISVPRLIDNDRRRSATLENMSVSNHEMQQKSMFVWDMDPYHADTAKAKTLLHLYFEYHDTGINCVLPRESFWRWVRNASSRSRDEIVLLYSVLALGSLFIADAALKEAGGRYAHLARLAEKEIASQHSLPLALARLHLAFYYFATGNGEQSCYHIHASFRTINALQLNVQEGIMNVPTDPKFWDFGLNRVELIECRRRIFWLGYLTERHCSFVSSITLFSNTEEDLFLHLPNNERHYQSCVDSCGPYFDGGHLERNTGASPSHYNHAHTYHASPAAVSSTALPFDLGAMALSITISQIWGDVQRYTYRSLHTHQAPAHDSFAHTTLTRLAEWHFSLPSHLQHTQTNMWRNIKCGNSGDLNTYLVLQCLYFATRIHLARFTRWQDLPLETIKSNIRAANSAAREILVLVSALERESSNTNTTPARAPAPGTQGSLSSSTAALPTPPTSTDRALAHPIISHAILLAADTVSSCGNLERHHRDTLRGLHDALAVVHRASAWFATAREQAAALARRVAVLEGWVGGGNANARGPAADLTIGGGVCSAQGKATWRCKEPCALVWLPREADVVYGVDEGLYIEAMAGPGGWPDVRG